jgi:prepilin peptidase CpaA
MPVFRRILFVPHVTRLPMFPTLESHHVATVVLALAGCWFDLRTRRIPNALTLGGALVGFGFSIVVHGPAGAATSLTGWLAGLALFVPFFALGGMGAGDVKLLGSFGAWLGPRDTLWTALFALIAGGVLAIVWGAATGYLRTALHNVRLLLSHWRVMGIRPLPELTLEHARGPRLPYALALFAGVVLALWFR